MRESSRFRLALVGLAAVLVACGGTPETPVPAAPQRGGTLVIGSISDVDAWNESLSRQSFANNLHRRIWLRLAQELGDSREHPPTYAPLLAESWETATDGRSITLPARSGHR